MARRWWKSGHLKPGEEIVEPGSVVIHDKGWIFKMVVNGIGAVCTLIVMFIFAVTKFKDGAWVVIILTPLLVTIFFLNTPSLQKLGPSSFHLKTIHRASVSAVIV